jgi:hypothetical protein
MWNPLKLLKAKPKELSGITILILQRRVERFTDEQLMLAMQRAWGRKRDETNFYGMSTFDGEGGLLKMDAMFFPMQHFTHRIDTSVLGERELPLWADHGAYTSFGYKCPGGLPAGKVRDTMGWLLGRFCAELLGANTVGLVFVEAKLLVPFTPASVKTLRSKAVQNPELLFAEPVVVTGSDH